MTYQLPTRFVKFNPSDFEEEVYEFAIPSSISTPADRSIRFFRSVLFDIQQVKSSDDDPISQSFMLFKTRGTRDDLHVRRVRAQIQQGRGAADPAVGRL
jgi:hypothetical protein